MESRDSLKEMRLSGMTFQMIADKVGGTKQGISQRIGKVHSDHITESELGRLVHSKERVENLRKQGKILSKRLGYYYLYSPDEVEKAIKLIEDRFCQRCEVRLETNQRKYCASCSKKFLRYQYPFLNAEGKRKHNLITTQWKRNHPEEWKAISKKASDKYEIKRSAKHFATAEYVVVAGAHLPIGDIFKAIDCRGTKLFLANGLSVPASCVRLLKRPKGIE